MGKSKLAVNRRRKSPTVHRGGFGLPTHDDDLVSARQKNESYQGRLVEFRAAVKSLSAHMDRIRQMKMARLCAEPPPMKSSWTQDYLK